LREWDGRTAVEDVFPESDRKFIFPYVFGDGVEAHIGEAKAGSVGRLEGRKIWIRICIEKVRMEAFGLRDSETCQHGKKVKWRVLFFESPKRRLD
jgi:hypothetical protein